MSYDHEAQAALNAKHVQNPQAGDYWEDHMVGVLQVVTVTHGMVIFFDKKKEVDAGHWTWDMSKPSALTIAEFAKRLCYSHPSANNRTWAAVHPNREL